MNNKNITLIAILGLCVYFCEVHASPILEINDATESEQQIVDIIKKGDSFVEADLYSQAITCYSDSLKMVLALQEPERTDSVITPLLSYIKYQLAQTYLRSGNNEAALTILEDHPQQEELYLLGLTYKNVNEYSKAKEAMHRYLYETPSDRLFYKDEAQFQLGLLDFLAGNYESANSFLEAIAATKDDKLSSLVQLYLARIEILKKCEKEALARLDQIVSKSRMEFIVSEAHYLAGKAHYHLGNYKESINSFDMSLRNISPKYCIWYCDTLQYLGKAQLALGNDLNGSEIDQQQYLLQAKETFRKLFSHDPNEYNALELGKVLTILAQKFWQEEFYLEAQQLLSKNEHIVSPKARSEALMLIARAAPSFEERDSHFAQLLKETTEKEDIANAWYMKGKNDFEEALRRQRIDSDTDLFQKAADEFGQAASLYSGAELQKIVEAKKFRAIALANIQRENSDLQALALIREIASVRNYSPDDQGELFYIEGIVASRLISENSVDRNNEGSLQNRTQSPYYNQAVIALKEASNQKSSTYADLALKHLAALYYNLGHYEEAEETYLALAQEHPRSPLCGEGWFWAGKCAQQLKRNPEISRERKKIAYENYPTSPYAAEAYLSMYSTSEYLQGDRIAIKHLQTFINKFPSSPLLIEAHYLLGLDLKRDRKSPEGKWLRKKSLTEAIEAFQEVETLFTRFSENGSIPDDRLKYFSQVRYQATLERALVNLAIANESIGAKKKIYLEYSGEVFKNLIADIENTENPYTKIFRQENELSPIYEESLFGLAQTNIKEGHDDAAEAILNSLLDKYKQMHIGRSYYLSRLWYELGMISSRRNQPQIALQQLHKAEEASKGDLLSTDQKLDLWIQQSLCHRSLGDNDHCILLLSKAVNDDAVSSLRLKAMYLRAETYELEGRHELARKQLESLSKKGGYWGEEAKQKMVTVYKTEGHHAH